MKTKLKNGWDLSIDFGTIIQGEFEPAEDDFIDDEDLKIILQEVADVIDAFGIIERGVSIDNEKHCYTVFAVLFNPKKKVLEISLI